jgi:hypothetical protein
MRQTSKLMLNSLYGRMGIQPRFLESVVINSTKFQELIDFE